VSLEEALFDYLSGVLSVGDRVYPMGRRPQEAVLPLVTYTLVAGPGSHYSHGGVSDHAVSYQFDCWAEDADDAMDLDAELRDALDGFRGSWGLYRIGSVFLTVVTDDYEAEAQVYRRLRQADIHYSEPEGS
jgi:hypothetical protein